MAAFAADELYAQQIACYDKIGNIYSESELGNFRPGSPDPFKTVYAEGACAFILETMESAQKRNAEVFGSILSFASYEEPGDFCGANLDSEGFEIAVNDALAKAKTSDSEIDLLVWSPRGDAQDEKILNVWRSRFPSAGIVTNVFNTGYIESASTISALAEVLFCLKKGIPIWRQKTGIAEIDNLPLPKSPKKILCAASSHVGNNFAAVFAV